MGFKDLQKIIQINQQKNNITKSSNEFDRFHNLPFWIWDQQEHKQQDIITKGQCCFNHVIGLPTKDNNIEKPLFDYQETIYNILQQYRHLWILKATGLGISEFFLRYMAWLCLRNDDYKNSQMVIVTGPNIDLAIKLIRRMKRLFEPKLKIYFDSKETVLELNNVRIESYPSNHIDSFRSLDNPKFILLDEADFFRKSEQEEVRAVAERYIAKSNPYIVLVSTPNAPEGLMQNIENEPFESCLYHRIKLDYRYGLDKIYSIEDIKIAKQSPSFEREYDLKYLGKIGNLYSQLSIQNAIERGKNYSLDSNSINLLSEKYMTIDPAFSSSKFAILVAEYVRAIKQIRILYAEELDHPSYEEALDHVFRIRKQMGNIVNIGVDASQPELITSLKKLIDERHNWSYVQEKVQYCKKHNIDLAQCMIVCPIVFNTESRSYMTSHSKRLLDDSRSLVAINPKFSKLITALRGAIFDETGKLDKDESPHNDLLDTFQMICTFFKFKSQGDY
ncbi:MAG TPA: DEAD/DEAH box helicase family protein [Nitrososphaeraceae archaeon]|nr:DEAD/DEAH box helicase family protein [Nitrososphaeraceae archaeon]